jgi:hypothetical protein
MLVEIDLIALLDNVFQLIISHNSFSLAQCGKEVDVAVT